MPKRHWQKVRRRFTPRTARTCSSTAPSYGATWSVTSPSARTGSRSEFKWGRSSTVPLETFTVTASFDPWRDMLDVWASMQMPKFPDQIAVALRMPASSVRVHHDVDVGGSYGVKRGIKHAVLAGYLAKRLGGPIRLTEDRLENMRGGDAHGPERLFDVEIAFDAAGVIRSMKMRALDNIGAYCGRSALQLGKPIGAIVGPYRMRSVQYRAVAVTTNKTVQEAVRGFGQGPTNYAIERAVEEVAAKLALDPIEVRRRNFIRAEEFPYTIPSGSAYDSGDYHAVVDKTLARCGYAALRAERERWRAQGLLAGIGIAACLEPSGGNAAFEALLNPKSTTTTWMESCRVMVDTTGGITATIHTNSSGQGHETLVATVVGEVLEIEPDRIRVIRPDSLSSLPGNSPVGSRMAIMLGGAAFHAAQKLKARMVAIAAHDLGIPADRALYRGGDVSDRTDATSFAVGRTSSTSRTAIIIGCRRVRNRDLHAATSCRCRPAGCCRRPTGGCRCIPALLSNFIFCCLPSTPSSPSRRSAATSSAMIAAR